MMIRSMLFLILAFVFLSATVRAMACPGHISANVVALDNQGNGFSTGYVDHTFIIMDTEQ